jgi:hypothetical protein
MAKQTYFVWYQRVLKELDRLDEPSVLYTDEDVNANTAYENGDKPKDYARRVANDREYQSAKFSGDLYR